MSAVTYRDANADDAASLADLFARSFIETFGHLYRPEDLAAFLSDADEAGWAEDLDEPGVEIRLAEVDGKAVALAKIGTIRLPVAPAGPAIELRSLYVLQPWHGEGIAHALMRWALDRAEERGAREMYLTVYVDNHRARRFYERYGFVFVAPYAFMVGEQADADHILRLDLGA